MKSSPLSLYSGNQSNKAIERGGCLSPAIKREQYCKAKFNVVEPIEYILDAKKRKKKTFQYIPILKFLQVPSSKKDIVEKLVHNKNLKKRQRKPQKKKKKNGLHCKGNTLLSGEDRNSSITLYSDDFEVCNPLGTSRKTRKLCSVSWVLSNLPPGSHSSLSSMFLTILHTV